MKHDVISLFPALALALISAPVAAWADANPDFDEDAKPILKAQPGLIQYIQSRFQVKDTGTAKYPGDDDHRPVPPYIFRARPIGSNGPYNLRLLIQPGPPGHILGVVDITKVHITEPGGAPSQPAVASQPPPQAPPTPQPPEPPQPPPVSAPAQAQAPEPPTPPPTPSAPASEPASQPSEPSADTPSGPIMGNGSPSSGQPSLAPPPDPAPPAQ
jgi:hypothetical protein